MKEAWDSIGKNGSIAVAFNGEVLCNYDRAWSNGVPHSEGAQTARGVSFRIATHVGSGATRALAFQIRITIP
jgi:hypothetical protein